MNSGIYSHFHPDEHPFVDKAADWIRRAAEQHASRLTDFLDPRQQFIIQTLAQRSGDVRIRADGGYPDAERQRVWIAPDYVRLEDEDMGIKVLAIESADSQISSLQHGDYLGALLGLGIKRDKLGDIQVLENGCHCLVASEIGDFIRLQLGQVHRVHVTTELLPPEGLRVKQTALEEMNLSVASLRLDGIVSDVYHLSRTKVLAPIKAGRCRVNWKVEEDGSKPLKEGDVVSLQGFGRFRVLEVEGMTKKGRIRMKIGKYR